MGLFSRKTIIQVSSVIYPMGEDPDRIPDMIKAGVITASLRQMSVPPAIRSTVIDGLGVKLAQAFSYAQNRYYAGMPNGLPKGHNTHAVLDSLCRDYLADVYPAAVVELHTSRTNFETDYETKFRELVADEYDFDFVENETLSATGAVDDGASMTHTGPFVDNVAHPGEIGYQLVFTNPDTSVETIDKWYDEADFNGSEVIVKRVIMEFRLDGARAITLSYEYGGSSNLLNVFLKDLDANYSGTFPAIVLKKDNVYLDDDAFEGTGPWEDSEAYLSSVQYGRRMGVNVDTTLTMIKDNESADDIDFCFVQPGVRLNSPNQAAVKYVYNYFDRLRLLFPNNKPAFDSWKLQADFAIVGGFVDTNLANGCPAQSVRFADPDNPKSSVDMEISWRYIQYIVQTGVLDNPYELECGAYEEVESKHLFGKLNTTETYDTTSLYLRKQLTETTYGELIVRGLRHDNYVYKGHSVQSGVFDTLNAPESDDGTGFIIPLDYTIYITLTPRERLQLAQEGVHIVFNCYVARKEKWYETGFFKFLMVVLAIVVIAFSFGTLTPQVTAIYTGFLAFLEALGPILAAALAAFLTALVMVAISVSVQWLAGQAGKWAAEHWGPAWGAVVQIFAMVALAYTGQFFGSNIFGMLPSTLAETALYAGRQLLSAMAAYTEYTYIALKDEIKTWEDYSGGANNPLKLVQDQFAEMFPELSTAQQAILPNPESLDEFLGRTLTTTDGLIYRLVLPIENMAELTLTPRL